jgi:high-affinity iron transporter
MVLTTALSLVLAVMVQRDDPAPIVRRLAATATLAAQEYALGVADGRVVLAAEVEEARLFLVEARRSAALLPGEWSAATVKELDVLVAMVDSVRPPDAVAGRVRRLTSTLSAGLGVSLDEIPGRAPALSRGQDVYQAQCARCHGEQGGGDGPAGVGLEPAPANLRDLAALRDQSPLDFYRRITIGVVGTAMPAYETELSAEDRWAVAAYASTLRLPAPAGQVPSQLRSFGVTARMSDAEVAVALGLAAQDSGAPPRIAAVRRAGPEDLRAEAIASLTEVRDRIDESLRLAGTGQHEEASARAFDAYMAFEVVEREVRSRNPSLASELEAAFAALRTRTAGGATPAELTAIRRTLMGGLERAERTFGDALSPRSLLLQSFVLLVREGLEAILIVGALLTFLARTGASHRARDIHVGVGAAVLASLVTALAIETVFQVSPARQEVLEGATMLVASAVLFYVSYWLLSKIEVARWTDFVRSRVHDAVTSGSALALASAAFLAVYREGFETVLFYKALVVAGTPGQTLVPVLAGMAAGAVVLTLVYVAISRFGVRLPLKPFFAITGAFLYYMAFVFAGRGVAELQEGGIIPTTVLAWAPRVPALGLYPTAESLGVQVLLAILLVVALGWTFLRPPAASSVASPPSQPSPPAGPRSPRRVAETSTRT